MSPNHHMPRRDFIKLGGFAALALASPLVLKPLAEASTGVGRHMETRLKMGTTVTITAVTSSKDQALAAMDRAWREMDRLIAIFDRHQSGTEISDLNAKGSLKKPHPELVRVMELAGRIHGLSGGVFDPTVTPLLTLIEDSFSRTGKAPDAAELGHVMSLVGYSGVSYDSSLVRTKSVDQKISLDAVAKGYIADRAAAVMRESGISNLLINAGGDIMALGVNHKGEPWRIGIQDPFKPDEFIKVIALSNRAVATSGSYEIFYDPKHEFHHLIDPKAGRPAVSQVSATTIAPTVAEADALATSAFIDPTVYHAAGHVEGLIVSRSGKQALTPGFRNYFERGQQGGGRYVETENRVRNPVFY